MKFNGSFGSWLKQRRKALDLTQQDVADQINYSIVTIRKIERDIARPSKQIAERLATVLAIAPDERAAFMSFARQVADPLPSLPLDLSALTPAHNLPPPMTPFIGRETELAQIADRLADPDCRLLTLVGPGGIGKTRLALQAASDRLGQFSDGVFFVSLTPVDSTPLIAAAIASALQISLFGPEDPHIQVANYLRGKHLLLVMDNYEHLLAGVGLLTDLLANAPQLKIVATSRERLNIREEWALPVEGLAFPAQVAAAELDRYSAVQLFVQRARQVQPSFRLADHTASVTAICQTVEGMPLAIELAAAWLRAMSCHEIAGQIRRDLDFLATPLRNMPERHRSLRAVFEHSWGLLADDERSALMKLAVFRGGIDLEAAEQVAGASQFMLAGLVDKSLLRLNSTGRYELHELLRQHAYEKLVEAGAADVVAQHHLAFFLELAEQTEARLYTPEQIAWFDRLEVNHDNLRAALAWSLTSEPETGLRLAAALEWFWHMRVYWTEGWDWLKKLLAAAEGAPAALKAKALHRAADEAAMLEDIAYANVALEQSLALARDTNDRWNMAWALNGMGYITSDVHYLEEALTLFRALGDDWGSFHALARLGFALTRGVHTGDGRDYERARASHEEALRLARQADVKSAMAWSLYGLGEISYYVHDLRRATTLFEQSVALFNESQERCGLSMALIWLGKCASLLGNPEGVRGLLERVLSLTSESHVFQRSLAWMRRRGLSAARSQADSGAAQWLILASLIWCQDSGDQVGVLYGLTELGMVVGDQGQIRPMATLLGAAANLMPPVGNLKLNHSHQTDYEQHVAAARAQLGEAAFAAAWAAGQAMSPDQAVAYVLGRAAATETA
jgi:predicted ATPase/DNA-binding XRE family transcriptional regulator